MITFSRFDKTLNFHVTKKKRTLRFLHLKGRHSKSRMNKISNFGHSHNFRRSFSKCSYFWDSYCFLLKLCRPEPTEKSPQVIGTIQWRRDNFLESQKKTWLGCTYRDFFKWAARMTIFLIGSFVQVGGGVGAFIHQREKLDGWKWWFQTHFHPLRFGEPSSNEDVDFQPFVFNAWPYKPQAVQPWSNFLVAFNYRLPTKTLTPTISHFETTKSCKSRGFLQPIFFRYVMFSCEVPIGQTSKSEKPSRELHRLCQHIRLIVLFPPFKRSGTIIHHEELSCSKFMSHE